MGKKLVVGGAVGAALLLGWSGPASAHPLGNFTTNTYAGLRVTDERILLDYVVDLAEIPALQASPQVDTDGDGTVGDAENRAYRDAECDEVAGRLALEVDRRALDMTVTSNRLTFPPGQGGLDTLRLECSLTASAPDGSSGDVRFVDRNFEGRRGWREITAVGDGTTLVATDVPSETVSARLASYPEEDVRSPLDQRSATLTVSPDGPALAGSGEGEGDGGPGDDGTEAKARGADRLTRAFTSLVEDRAVTPLFAVLAFGIAMVLGTLHAVAPGHGKTLMAAYVVGKEGTLRQLTAIGLTVAITHTGGVLVLGLGVSVSETFAPDRFLEWATIVSGLLLAAVGVSLVLRRRHGHGHGHDHDHGHAHGHEHDHGLGHDHGVLAHEHEHLPQLAMAVAGPPAPTGVATLLGPAPASHDRADRGPGTQEHHGPVHDVPRRSWRSVVAMGFAGGLVPSPSALVVLLGATALGRLWFGVLLVLAYGLGMAATLVVAGLLLLRTKAWLDRWALERQWFATATRVLPVITAAILVAGGLSLAGRAYLAM